MGRAHNRTDLDVDVVDGDRHGFGLPILVWLLPSAVLSACSMLPTGAVLPAGPMLHSGLHDSSRRIRWINRYADLGDSASSDAGITVSLVSASKARDDACTS